MGRSRTSGIVTDAGGNRIINKVHQGVRIYARLGRVTLATAEGDLARESRRSKKKRSAKALLAELSAKHASGT